MPNKFYLLAGIAGVVIGIVLFISVGDSEEPPAPPDTLTVTELPPSPPVTVTQPDPVDLPVPVEPEPEPEPEPEVVDEEPPAPAVVDSEPAAPESEPLPGLNNSDPYVLEQVGTLQNSTAIRRQLASMQIIRKFVGLVDGMSRGEVPDRDLPVSRTQGNMTVTEVNDEFYRLDPATYSRFSLLVNTFAAMDSRRLVALYKDMSPLFDAAYAELGYRNRQFSTALSQAIDNVLAVQMPLGEILLTRPSVNYEFADPGLESRTDLEKLFIRMGPDNTAKVQAKVRELKALL